MDLSQIPGAQVTADQVIPHPRTMTGVQFLALWQPAEVAAAIAADPALLVGALRAAAQGIVDLDGADTVQLVQLAETKGALSAPRAAAILAGTPPT